MISFGPCFLDRLTRQTYEERRDFIAEYVLSCPASYIALMKGCFTGPWDLTSPMDIFETFDSDTCAEFVQSLPPSEQPNQGWLWFYYRDGIVDSVMKLEFFDLREGFGNPDACEWGYVIWDRERLLEWGAKEPLMAGWESREVTVPRRGPNLIF